MTGQLHNRMRISQEEKGTHVSFPVNKSVRSKNKREAGRYWRQERF